MSPTAQVGLRETASEDEGSYHAIDFRERTWVPGLTVLVDIIAIETALLLGYLARNAHPPGGRSSLHQAPTPACSLASCSCPSPTTSSDGIPDTAWGALSGCVGLFPPALAGAQGLVEVEQGLIEVSVRDGSRPRGALNKPGSNKQKTISPITAVKVANALGQAKTNGFL